jgi:cell division protein FtsL
MDKEKKSRLGTFVIIGFFLYFAYTLVDQQKILYDKELQLNNINAKVEREQKLNDELLKQMETLHSNEYIEKIAREKLGMVKKGEKIFIDANK